MTDERKAPEGTSVVPPPDYLDLITPADVQRYIVGRKIKDTCPMCGANEWTFHEFEDIRGVGAAAVNPQAQMPLGGKFLLLSVLTCNNCAFVWTMARSAIANWLKENPA